MKPQTAFVIRDPQDMWFYGGRFDKSQWASTRCGWTPEFQQAKWFWAPVAITETLAHGHGFRGNDTLRKRVQVVVLKVTEVKSALAAEVSQ
jgi:hypothetical protein